MAYRRYFSSKFLLFLPLLLILMIAVACGEDATPVVVEKEVIKEVPVEVIKEVIVEKEVIKEVPVVKEVIVEKEVIKEVPVEKEVVVEKEVIKEVKVEVVKEVILIATPTPTPPPAAMEVKKVDRLVVALGPPQWETNVPWEGSEVQLDAAHIYDSLIGQDRFTGEFDASEGLADKWSVNPEGTDWTFELKKGIQFHFGWGEFTAADVKHTFERATGEGSIAGNGAVYRRIIGDSSNLEIVNDYKIIFHQKQPEIFSVTHYESGRAGAARVLSKALWDAEGKDGYQKRPTGTGSYQWIKRIPGNSTLAERVENHWRHTPDFKEIRVLFTAEEATRMAGLLAEEIHIVAASRDLQKTGQDAGMELVFSVLPSRQSGLNLGGQYYLYPEDFDPIRSPWADQEGTDSGIKIREAMNRAINRQELQDTLFLGQGEIMYIYGWHQGQEGWNAEWDDRWEDMYGYDLERAKELLAEAGYPNGFPLTMFVLERADMPEAQAMVEVIATEYWAKIGLKVTLKELEYSKNNELGRARKYQGVVRIHTGSFRPPIQTMKSYYSNASRPTGHWYITDFTNDKYDKLTRVTKIEDRHTISLEAGNHLFDRYTHIPLFWFRVALLVNPKVVSEYVFPGNTKPFASHLEYVKAPAK